VAHRATLSFLPAAYFFKDTWLAYVLVGLPVLAFGGTLGIGLYWAVRHPDRLLSEDFAILDWLKQTAQTEGGLIQAGQLTPNPTGPKIHAGTAPQETK
jgi:hypothetical protein